MTHLWRKKYRKKSSKTKCIVKNGKILLEKLISIFNGKRNPITNFTFEELDQATNSYDTANVVWRDSYCQMYRACLSNRQIFVMKFDSSDKKAHERCINNIVFATQMRHKNFLRLLGCCLETETPILVFQYVEYKSFAYHIYHQDQPNVEPVLWMQRLKIAMGIAYAVAYLHVGFPRPILLRNINTWNILFDEECVAKLFDFSLAISIPEGETYVQDAVVGTTGYIAPEYWISGFCDERCDVYLFGGLLLNLLTGKSLSKLLISSDFGDQDISDHVKKLVEDNKMKEMVDPIILGDIQCREKEQQLQAFTNLAIKCFSKSPENRPTMVDVTKQLMELYRSCISP